MPAKGQRTAIRKRFASKYKVDEATGCWNWISASQGRYGVLWVNQVRRADGAHRISYRLFKGAIPRGKYVLHNCDNGHCVNPDHLYLGTPQQNMDDKVKRGRMPDQRGQNNPYWKKRRRNEAIGGRA
jgi:hypothetical protein